MPDKMISSSKDKVIVPLSHYAAEPLPAVSYPEQAHYGHIPEGRNRGLEAARNLLKLAQERDVNRLNQLRSTPDPRVPIAAHRDELAKEAAKGAAEFDKAHAAALDTIDAELRETNTHIEAMGGFTVNPNAAEIRSVIRDMDQQEREAVIGKAVEDLDESLLASLFGKGVHPMLLGVSAEFLKAHWNRYLHAIVPDYLATRDQLTKAKARLEEAKPLVEATYQKCGEGVEEFSEQIAKAEAVRNRVN